MKDNVRFIGARYSDSVTARQTPHEHPYYELNFMTNGKTRMEINGQLFDYGSFDFILIPPGALHILNQSESERFDNYVIWFSSTEEGAKTLPKDKIIKLHDYNGIVETLCSEIFRTYRRSKMAEADLISYYLEAVVYHMERCLQIDIAKKEESGDPYARILKFINANALYNHVSVQQLAEMMNLSQTHFSREFKKRYMTTPIEYIVNLKIAEAKKLLRESSMTIKEIAESLGYSDQLYFSKQFSKVVGVSPMQWRKAENSIR